MLRHAREPLDDPWGERARAATPAPPARYPLRHRWPIGRFYAFFCIFRQRRARTHEKEIVKNTSSQSHVATLRDPRVKAPGETQCAGRQQPTARADTWAGTQKREAISSSRRRFLGNGRRRTHEKETGGEEPREEALILWTTPDRRRGADSLKNLGVRAQHLISKPRQLRRGEVFENHVPGHLSRQQLPRCADTPRKKKRVGRQRIARRPREAFSRAHGPQRPGGQ